MNKIKFVLKLKNKVICDNGGSNIGHTKFGGKILSAILSDSGRIVLLESIITFNLQTENMLKFHLVTQLNENFIAI